MRHLTFAVLTGAAVGVVFPTIASAADLPRPVRPAPIVAPVANWTGFYIGANVGYLVESDTSGVSNFTQPAPVLSTPMPNTASGNSAVGGFQAGYNWQFAPRWVVGIEGDFDWTNPGYAFCRPTDAGPPCADAGRGFLNISQKTNWLASVRGRLGFAWFDNVLVYGTAGGAWANIDTTLSSSCFVAGCGNNGVPNGVSAAFSETKGGWVAGIGVESKIWNNWTARFEWLHYDFGTITNALGAPAAFGSYGVSYSRHVQYDTFRVGANYLFNWR